jgi:hypothetical protein
MSSCQSNCSSCNPSNECEENEVEEVKLRRREDCKAFMFSEEKLQDAPFKYQRIIRGKMDEATPLFVDMSTRTNPYDQVTFWKTDPATGEDVLDTSIDKTTFFKDYYSVPFVVEVLFPDLHELTGNSSMIGEDILQWLREIPLADAELMLNC